MCGLMVRPIAKAMSLSAEKPPSLMESKSKGTMSMNPSISPKRVLPTFQMNLNARNMPPPSAADPILIVMSISSVKNKIVMRPWSMK